MMFTLWFNRFLMGLVIFSLVFPLVACGGSPEPMPEIGQANTPAPEPEWSYKLFINHQGEGENWTTSITMWAKSANLQTGLPKFVWEDGFEYTLEGWGIEGRPFKGHIVTEAKISLNNEPLYLLPMGIESIPDAYAYIP